MSPDPGRLTGVLVLVVGPSGAGKDTIMRGARGLPPPDSGIVFGRRVVTRPPDASEDNDAATPESFEAARRRGDFILDWEAHGLRYGIPKECLDALAEGRVVVVNGSRSVVARARQVFPEIRIVLVTAPPDILEARIRARGRDDDPSARLSRDATSMMDLRPDLIIDNSASLEAAVARLSAFLRSLSQRFLLPGR